VTAATGSAEHADTQLRQPVTLVNVAAPIYSFAHDDGMLAWEECCTGGWETRSTIKVGGALDGRAVTVSRPDGGDGPYVMEEFALGGRRVVWGGFVDCCNSGYGEFETAAPGSKPKRLRGLDLDYWEWGEYPTGAAGDGTTLVYSIATIEPSYGSDDQVDSWAVAGGGVWRVVGSKSVRVPHTPPTAMLAVARRAIALVPADQRRYHGPCSEKNPLGCAEVRIAPGARVEVRDAVNGVLIATFAPKGRVAALGMDEETVAVVVRSGREARVEWYSANSGKPLGTSSVPRSIADSIDVSGHAIVLHRGKTILAVDTGTRQIRDLALVSSPPVGLSIEGDRVAWAEKVGNRGAIRAVTVG
jgi:hypothetical protein